MHTVYGVLLMDTNGKRLFAKYYDSDLADSPKQQSLLEQQLFTRTSKQISSIMNFSFKLSGFEQNEVALIDGYIAVFRRNMDVGVYVLGEPSVNELILACVLDTIFGAFEELLK